MSIPISAEPKIHRVRVDYADITVDLADGRKILGSGQGIHWPAIDEDISVEGMFFGVPARRPPLH